MTYTCSHCRGTFEPAWSDEEAKAEAAETFPDVPLEECAIVCDECYKKIMSWAKENIS